MADVFDGAVSTTLSYFRKEIARLDFKKTTAEKVRHCNKGSRCLTCLLSNRPQKVYMVF